MLDLIIVLSIIAAITWIIFGFFLLMRRTRITVAFGIISLLLSTMVIIMFYNDPILSSLTIANKTVITIIMVFSWIIFALIFLAIDIDIIQLVLAPIFAIDIAFIIIFCIIIIPAKNSVKASEYEKEITATTQIEKISDNLTFADGVSESYLYSGNDINDKKIYTFYCKQIDGSYLQVVIPAEDTIIFSTEDGETPHCNTIVRKWYTYNNNFDPPLKSDEPCETKTIYEVYVPNGTISRHYNLDDKL